ncbi:MAG: beta-galactosidase [Deltaproteobacteria bacterium]|nr:beta-galactosidase [Deltaproteobacteria bacterium]
MRPTWFSAWLLAAVVVPSAARAAVGDNTVGVNIHVGYPSFIAAAADLGVAWVRVDGNWDALNPANGSYNWGWMDETVNRAHAAGLKVFMSLGYGPAWVPRHGDTDGRAGNDVPDSSAEWAAFVTAAVQHYRALGVTHFGLWNEANLESFFEGTPQEYVDLIAVPGAAALRAACADCKVLGPEAANVGECDDWLEAVLTRAPITTWDIITHHSYNGFADMGTNIWDGDTFINALEEQRFFFTRRSLRQILDLAGWNGEVWITETGYRANPIGDAGEEGRQATYVRRVLEEQLARAWYTNTFFYEIEDCGPAQPACDIDGFGLMHATSSGDEGTKTFPGDYRRKPAFQAIKDFIAAHPAITGQTPPPQCGDGDDNDGDGRTDGADRGCSGALDDNEADDPPRRTLSAYVTPGLNVDGEFTDWGAEGWVTLGAADWHGTEPLGAGDQEVRVAARWSSAGLALALEVTDDTQENGHADADLWQGDSVQLAFDTGRNGGTGYDATDDHEINFARVAGQPRSYRFKGPAGATSDWQFAVQRAGTVTRYEIQLPPPAVPGLPTSAGNETGFSFLVNDADGSGRAGWTEWTAGIGVGKVPELFGRIHYESQSAGGGVASSSGPAPQSSSSVAGASSSAGGGGSSAAVGTSSTAGGGSSGTAPGSSAAGVSGGGAGRASSGDASDDVPPDACACSDVPRRTPLAGLVLLGALATFRRRRH